MARIEYKEQIAIKTSRGPFILSECSVCHASVEDQVTQRHTAWHIKRRDFSEEEVEDAD